MPERRLLKRFPFVTMTPLDLVRVLAAFVEPTVTPREPAVGRVLGLIERAPTCESRFNNKASTARWSIYPRSTV